MKVYIIDDEPKIRRGLASLVKMYRPQWPEASIAGNAEAALEDPCFWQTEILFLDIQLPGMDGLTLLKQIRQRNAQMQVAVISGYAEFAFAQKAMSMGVSQYLLKPIDVGDVRTVLESAEEKSRSFSQEQEKRAAIDRSIHDLQEKFFANVLFGKELFSPEQLSSQLDRLKLKDSPFVLAYFAYREPISDPASDARIVQRTLAESLQRLAPEERERFVIYQKSGILAILLGTDGRMDKLMELFQKNQEMYLTGFSFIHGTLLELPAAYREAVGSLDTGGQSCEVPLMDETLYVEALLNRQAGLHPSVEATLKFIERNYQGDLSLRQIAAHVHLHSSYLSELFKKETGCSLCNFIADYRLTEAKRALRQTSAKVSAVAEAVGFSDYHYFSQVFSRRVGVSPRKFRAQGSEPQTRQEI